MDDEFKPVEPRFPSPEAQLSQTVILLLPKTTTTNHGWISHRHRSTRYSEYSPCVFIGSSSKRAKLTCLVRLSRLLSPPFPGSLLPRESIRRSSHLLHSMLDKLEKLILSLGLVCLQSSPNLDPPHPHRLLPDVSSTPSFLLLSLLSTFPCFLSLTLTYTTIVFTGGPSPTSLNFIPSCVRFLSSRVESKVEPDSSES